MHDDAIVGTVVTVVGLLLVAALSAIVLKRIRLPYTVGLVLVGLALGYLTESVPQLAWLSGVQLSPEIILFVFLPTLIFESAFNLDSRLLAKNLAPVVLLAVPGLLLSTALVGGAMSLATELPLGPALLFGALISATDPVAVVALFKELGAPKRLAILVEGESLFNDATAIVLFQIVLAVVAGGALGLATLGEGTGRFLIVSLGGVAVGALIGYLMIRSLAVARDEPLVEVVLSTVVAYAAFILADHYLHVSGVMATVGAGVLIGTLGSTRFSPELRHYLHQFWEYAAFVANSLIFLLVGMSIRLEGLLTEWQPLLWAILVVLIARALVVFGLVPLVGKLPGTESIDWRYRGVMYWGGLRGAVALALALSLPHEFAYRELLITLSVGVVLFTLISGGLTMKPLISALRLNQPSLLQRFTRVQALLAAKREASRRLAGMAGTGHYSRGELRELHLELRRQEREARGQLESLGGESSGRQLEAALWSEALTVEKTAYRDLFQHASISEAVLRELELELDLQRDALEHGRLPRPLEPALPLELRAAEAAFALIEKIAPASRIVQRHRLWALATKYEHELAMVEAGRRVEGALERIAELSGARPEQIEKLSEYYHDREARSLARMDSIAEHFPEYVAAVQRRAAQRIALDGEADAVEALAGLGAVSESVAREARASVEATQRRLLNEPLAELEPDPSELLAGVPLFEAVAAEDRERLLSLVSPRTFLAGEVVIEQGSRGSSLFLIARGVLSVEVRDGERPPRRLATLRAGDFVGEMALLSDEPRRATVRAVSDCRLYELSRRQVESVSESSPGLRADLEAAYRRRQEELAG